MILMYFSLVTFHFLRAIEVLPTEFTFRFDPVMDGLDVLTHVLNDGEFLRAYVTSVLDLLVDGVDVRFERVFEREIPAAVFAFVLDPFVDIADVDSFLVRSRELSAAYLAWISFALVNNGDMLLEHAVVTGKHFAANPANEFPLLLRLVGLSQTLLLLLGSLLPPPHLSLVMLSSFNVSRITMKIQTALRRKTSTAIVAQMTLAISERVREIRVNDIHVIFQ